MPFKIAIHNDRGDCVNLVYLCESRVPQYQAQLVDSDRVVLSGTKSGKAEIHTLRSVNRRLKRGAC
jgi:cob(I)alamin adenosyltransferase